MVSSMQVQKTHTIEHIKTAPLGSKLIVACDKISNLEDLISIGTLGLIKAINTFKLDKNIKLATYASRCIENEILMYLRKKSKARVEISLDEPLKVD